MGVCYIVFDGMLFDIDGMLFQFFINFLNIEKKIKKILFLIFHVLFAFYAISSI